VSSKFTGGVRHVVNSDFTRDQFLEKAAKLYDEHKYVTFHWELGRQRSETQNAALQVYCENVATALNDAGLDMQLVLAEQLPASWTKTTVRECMWRPLQKALTGKTSTTEPMRTQYNFIFEHLYRHLASRFGLSVPWPSKQERDQ